MPVLSRRSFLGSLTSLVAAGPAAAQSLSVGEPPTSRFSYDDVIRRARQLSGFAYDTTSSALPEALRQLDFDAYRDIRFRPDKALLAPGPFRMQMFHPGFLFNKTVTVNVVRDGISTPVPYSGQLFDYGRNHFDKPLPVNLGFAGFRLHYPLNSPSVLDEVISFLGSSYFRFLGRDQRYGLSARGLAINSGGVEEFPVFREFWVEMPERDSARIAIHALLDSPSVTGAYQFYLYPQKETVIDVTATLFPRKTIERIGIAPLTSMFFTGENDRRFPDDFRPEVHDSDGLLLHTGKGEWIWRPLRNPANIAFSSFMGDSVQGFGLVQRDRIFEHYEDLEAAYELRPGYWVQPVGDWGEGSVDLVELSTSEETNDNIVVAWIPKKAPEAGQTLVFRYRITAVTDTEALHPGARVINTHRAKPTAVGAPAPPNTERFIVDFAGGDLPYYLKDPDLVQIEPSTSAGQITRTFLVPNPKTKGFRAGIDVRLDPGQATDLRLYLRAGKRALTETWTYPWQAR